jgi:TrmH RNA methyltransferase
MVEADELERVAGSVMHGGIVALAQPKPVPDLDPEEAATWARRGEPLLILDGIGNPHNLGAIVRTAAFFGLPRIVLSDHPAQAGPSDASYRVAEGGLEYVELYRSGRFAQGLQRLRRSYRVVATAAENGKPIEELRQSDKPLAVVLGNEEHGLPKATLAACDAIVTIPGSGFVQSLNVSATAAILIQALARRR